MELLDQVSINVTHPVETLRDEDILHSKDFRSIVVKPLKHEAKPLSQDQWQIC